MARPRTPRRISPSGRPEHVQLEDNVQSITDALHNDIRNLSAADIAYTPANPSDWVSPAPTTVAQAFDRLAAAGGVTPVP